MTVWYKTNPNRYTYRELWRTSGRGLWPFAKAVWRKWFDIQLPPTSGFAFPDAPRIVALDSLPERPQEVLRRLIALVERHGFRFVFCHQEAYLGNFEEYRAILISADGLSLANLVWLKIGAEGESNLILGSRTQTRRLLTCGHPRGADAPPEFDAWHRPGKFIRIDELIAQHSRRLDRLGREQILPATESDIAARIIENQKLCRAFDLARGVLVPMTQEEIERLSGPVMAEVVAEGGNPYRAPREDEAAAQARPRRPISRSALGMSICSGFAGGAIFGAGLGAISLRDALDEGIPLWSLLVGFFIVTPLFSGGAGAVVGLACWVGKQAFRRLIP